MFVSQGSMFQLVIGILICLGFLAASAWFQPFRSQLANSFKMATEVSLVITLSLCVMAKVDLSLEDVSEDFVGAMMILVNTVFPGVSLAAGIVVFGLTDLAELTEGINSDDFVEDENPMHAALQSNPMHEGEDTAGTPSPRSDVESFDIELLEADDENQHE